MAYVVVTYPNSRMTEVRLRLRLRSVPVPGANNRADVEALYSYDRELGAPLPHTGEAGGMCVCVWGGGQGVGRGPATHR